MFNSLSNVLYPLFLAGAVYGGIRSDLKALHQRVNDTHEAMKDAHRRIDNLLGRKP